MQPPAWDDFSSGEDSDQEDDERPLTREELKRKTLRGAVTEFGSASTGATGSSGIVSGAGAGAGVCAGTLGSGSTKGKDVKVGLCTRSLEGSFSALQDAYMSSPWFFTTTSVDSVLEINAYKRIIWYVYRTRHVYRLILGEIPCDHSYHHTPCPSLSCFFTQSASYALHNPRTCCSAKTL